MKVYCVLEIELKTLSALNAEATVLFSIAGSALSIGLSTIIGARLQWETVQSSTRTAVWVVFFVCVIVALGSAFWARSVRATCKSMLHKIEEQSSEVPG